jgi:hypothetical protein
MFCQEKKNNNPSVVKKKTFPNSDSNLLLSPKYSYKSQRRRRCNYIGFLKIW